MRNVAWWKNRRAGDGRFLGRRYGKAALFGLGLLAGTHSLAPAACAATFPEALAMLSDRHPRVAAAAQTAAAGRAEVDAARAAMRPQVSVVGDAGFNRSGLTSRSNTAFLPGVRATQLLYDGGRTGAEIRRRGFRADALEVQEARVADDLAARLAEAYLEWTRQGALLAIAEDQLAALQTLRDMVAQIAGFDRGRASDVALVDSRLSQSLTARDARRLAAADARAVIRQIVAAPVEPSGDMPAPVELLPPSLDAAIELVDTAPQVREAELTIRESEAAVDAARAWRVPTVSLDGGSDSESSLTGQTRLFGSAQLRLRTALTPIDGGGGRARLAAARASASSARFEASYARLYLGDELRRQWTLTDERRARLPALEALVRNTDASRDVVFEQFRIGRRSVLDLLSFEVERFTARATLENERRDLIAAQYRLLAALGRLRAMAPADGAPAGGLVQ